MSETVKLSDLTPDERNANTGTERGRWMLERSLEKLGAGRSILLDKNGRIIAGNKTAQIAGEIGIDDVTIIRTDGKKLVAVLREDLDLEDADGMARELAYADNRVGQISLDFNPDIIASDLAAGVDLGDWWRDAELIDLGIGDGFEKPIGLPNPRNLPIDAIYTLQSADATCCLAVRAGLKYGIQSKSFTLCPYCVRGDEAHRVAFIDNDYFDYDHARHLDVVKGIRPEYATVMDVMTTRQCQKDNITYYELSQILEWAEELGQYAQNVIVIPKYDCLNRIPDKFILGYSVPTSHGGTPLPVDAFRGRRIHLLGGSWKAQLAHMAILGDDVVSLDNNYVNNQARFAQFNTLDGGVLNLTDVGFPWANARYVSLALSFSAMGAKINELYSAGNDTPA